MADHPSADIHSLLARQLRRYLRLRPRSLDEKGADLDAVTPEWRTFLDAVNEAYHQSDDDRRMLERALDLSSQELLEANTEMQALLEEREQFIHELEDKNAEMERLTYAISHDLKGPVFTIQGFLTMLRQDAREGHTERLEQDVEQIGIAATQIGRLLKELLEFTRIGHVVNRPEDVSLAEVAREATALVAGQIVERGVEVDVAADLPTLVADRSRLLQVFQNLIENAVKFMGSQSAPRVEVFARRDNGEAVYCVRDNGIGIDPQDHEKIFRLFDRVEPDSDGTGIGLSLVQRIVEVHGGRAWVESKGEGRGSTFCFTLPQSVPS